MKRVIILRGFSGSGKSDFCNDLGEHTYLSLDDFWTGPREGKAVGVLPYQFDISRIKQAVAWLENRLDEALGDVFTLNRIVIDNTHTRLWEMAQWIKKAEAANAVVKIVHIERELPACYLGNSKGVEWDKLQEMADRWEPVCDNSPEARIKNMEKVFYSFLKASASETDTMGDHAKD